MKNLTRWETHNWVNLNCAKRLTQKEAFLFTFVPILCASFQLLAMPGEVIIAVCTHLDPRSIFNLGKAHVYLRKFIDDKQIWKCVTMHSNWSFTNATFLAMIPFAPKVEHISLKHTGSVQQPHVVSLPQGILTKMVNLRSLSVESGAFTQGYFVQLLPKLHTLRLLNCPNFDVDTLVEVLQRLRCSKSLHIVDVSGVPNVASFNVWQICSLCLNLQEAVTNAVMGDFVAEQCLLDCPNLKHFDCCPLRCTQHKWADLCKCFPNVHFGSRICSTL